MVTRCIEIDLSCYSFENEIFSYKRHFNN